MNEQLQQALTEAIDVLKAGANQAAGELPLLVQEYLWWGVVQNSLWLGVILAGAIAAACLGWAWRNDLAGPAPLLYGVAGFLLFMAGLPLSTIIKIQFAPRVYLLEQIRELLR